MEANTLLLIGVVFLVALVCGTVLILSRHRSHVNAGLKCVGFTFTLEVKGREQGATVTPFNVRQRRASVPAGSPPEGRTGDNLG
jgi:hypothetical protein